MMLEVKPGRDHHRSKPASSASASASEWTGVLQSMDELRASVDQHRQTFERRFDEQRTRLDEHMAEDARIQAASNLELEKSNNRIAGLDGKFDEFLRSLRSIETAIRGEDLLGSQSLSARLETVKQLAQTAASKATVTETRLELLEKAKDSQAADDKKNRTAVVVAVVAALGSITAAVVALIAATWRHP